MGFVASYTIDACITEVKEDGIVRLNMRFQIVDISCDTLAKDESINVYGFNSAGKGRTLLFKYDPWSYDQPVPTIDLLNGQIIRLSVPNVSSIFFQLDRWQGHAIVYNIGRNYYPDPNSGPSP